MVRNRLWNGYSGKLDASATVAEFSQRRGDSPTLLRIEGAILASLTVENYVKTIYLIVAGQEGAPAATGQIAAALGVSPGTVTAMLKTLGEGNLATYTPYEGAKLTRSGNRLALRMLRRHRLIELFLSRTLDMTWDQVHEEAEHIEHAVSDLLVDRIDAYLGFPASDPHGDPIPRADGSVDEPALHRLVDCTVGESIQLARVLDQSPEFLRYLADNGLSLQAVGMVTANHHEAGILTVEIGGKHVTLGREAAGKMLVKTPEAV